MVVNGMLEPPLCHRRDQFNFHEELRSRQTLNFDQVEAG